MQKPKSFPVLNEIFYSNWSMILLHAFGGVVCLAGSAVVVPKWTVADWLTVLQAATIAGFGGFLLGVTLFVRLVDFRPAQILYLTAVWAGSIALMYLLFPTFNIISLCILICPAALTIGRVSGCRPVIALLVSWLVILILWGFFVPNIAQIAPTVILAEGALIGASYGGILVILLGKKPATLMPRGRLMIGDDGEFIEAGI